MCLWSVLNHIIWCPYHLCICAHILSEISPFLSLSLSFLPSVSVCVWVCATFLPSDMQHSCHCLAAKGLYLQKSPNSGLVQHYKSTESPLKWDVHASFLIETHVSH